jgi:hypothetical protein
MMRRIVALTMATALLVAGCSDSGAGSSPSPTPTLTPGAWTFDLAVVATSVGQQITGQFGGELELPEDLDGFFLFVDEGQTLTNYTVSGPELFSFCVESSEGWVAFNSEFGGVVAFGQEGECSVAPTATITALRSAALEVGLGAEAAVEGADVDSYYDLANAYLASASVPEGLVIGGTEVGLDNLAVCVEAEDGSWATFSQDAYPEDRVLVGILGAC